MFIIGGSRFGNVQGWKRPGFKKKQPSGFLYICPEERVFKVSSVSRILLAASRL
jgi:hypothetical protein